PLPSRLIRKGSHHARAMSAATTAIATAPATANPTREDFRCWPIAVRTAEARLPRPNVEARKPRWRPCVALDDFPRDLDFFTHAIFDSSARSFKAIGLRLQNPIRPRSSSSIGWV